MKSRKKTEPIVIIRRRPKPKLKTVKPEKKAAKKQPPKKKKPINKPVNKDFYKSALPEIMKVLPPKMPYKIRIDKDIFDQLKAMYPGKRKQLRKSIGTYLNRATKKREYLNAVIGATHRYGFSSKRYPISDKSKEIAKEKIELKNKFKKKHK